MQVCSQDYLPIIPTFPPFGICWERGGFILWSPRFSHSAAVLLCLAFSPLTDACHCQEMPSIDTTVTLMESHIFCPELSRGSSVRKAILPFTARLYFFFFKDLPGVLEFSESFKCKTCKFQLPQILPTYPLLTIFTHNNLIHATFIFHLDYLDSFSSVLSISIASLKAAANVMLKKKKMKSIQKIITCRISAYLK